MYANRLGLDLLRNNVTFRVHFLRNRLLTNPTVYKDYRIQTTTLLIKILACKKMYLLARVHGTDLGFLYVGGFIYSCLLTPTLWAQHCLSIPQP